MKEHRQAKGIWKTFAGRFYCHRPVYYEIYQTRTEAIRREKEIKNMSRERKLELIRQKNPMMNTYSVY